MEEILALAPVADVLNTRHELAREKGWKEKPPSKAAFVAAVLGDNNLLRRPITIAGDRVVVGFDEPKLKALLER